MANTALSKRISKVAILGGICRRAYKAPALFFSKEEVNKHLRATDREDLIRPTYYKEKMREAKKLIRELRAESSN